MILNNYNEIIREHFDISDNETRKCIIALEDAEQTQLLSALSNALYDKIISKVDDIEFGSIPKSRGDITRVDGFANTMECLDIMRRLVVEYRENPECVDVVLTAVENIKNRRSMFMKAYALNMEIPMVLYNLVTLSIQQSVSFLIAVCIQYIKDPSSDSVRVALDKVAYEDAKNGMLFEQLFHFNTACASGELDNTFREIMKNGGKLHEDTNVIEEPDCKTITITIDTDNKASVHCVSPFEDDMDGDQKVVLGSCDSKEPVNELSFGAAAGFASKASGMALKGLGTAAGVGATVAAGISISIAALFFLIKFGIPMMRNMVYFFINSKAKTSDMLAVQAEFIEANAHKVEYSAMGMDYDDRQKVVNKQLKIADRLKRLSNFFAIDKKKAEKEAKAMIAKDKKKHNVKDLEEYLPVDIMAKSQLF